VADVVQKYDAFWLHMAAGKLIWDNEIYRAAFLADTYTPNVSLDSTWSDISTHQITGATGYPVGGPALTNKVISATMLDADNILLPLLTATFRYIVLYQDGTVGGVVQPLLGYYEPVSGSNVTIQSSDYLIEWPTSGVFPLS